MAAQGYSSHAIFCQQKLLLGRGWTAVSWFPQTYIIGDSSYMQLVGQSVAEKYMYL
jgi:hypothetical protein